MDYYANKKKENYKNLKLKMHGFQFSKYVLFKDVKFSWKIQKAGTQLSNPENRVYSDPELQNILIFQHMNSHTL